MRIRKILKEAVKLIGMPLSLTIGHPLVSPSVAGVSITWRCNSRCRMCHFWKNSPADDDEFSTAQIVEILKMVRQLGIQFISFAAEGEVFARKDACRIFRAARGLGFDFSINTNGLYLPEEFVQDVHRLNPFAIIFGLDTTDALNYEEIRGIPEWVGKSIKLHK